ncbi:MAG TPA: SAM-dependent methyltransferase [Micromonosporaceae bacterium]|jgi:hypothetical protein|nr:SAM-dependent methyltransferase [Micromonosporaceae bacterium]
MDRPSAARIYDYLLGGSYNFAVDREIAEQLLAVDPRIRTAAQANRAFLRRAVRHLAGAGVRQFLDLGSGIPTVGNVHEVAQRAAPDAKVVYVDIDPMAVAHSREIIGADPHVAILQADVRDPGSILTDPAVRDLIDFTAPIAILLVALLHFIPDSDRPAEFIAEYRDAVPSGSYLVIAQVARVDQTTAAQEEAKRAYTRAVPVTLRKRDELRVLFAGFDLIEPGLVEAAQWRPESADAVELIDLVPQLAGVGVKPQP